MLVCHECKMEAILAEKLLGSGKLNLFFLFVRIYIDNIIFAN